MIAAIVIPLCALAIAGLVYASVEPRERDKILVIVLGGFVLRLVLLEVVMRRMAFFSHGVAGGDCLLYEMNGSLIAQLWRFGHVHFVTEAEMPTLGQAVLPCNVLGLLEYFNGSPAPLAGTAINGLFACWTVIMIYRFIRDRGAEPSSALRVMVLVLFGPSFLYHTSDTYKDGINAFLVIASLINTVRLAQSFSPARLGYLGLSLFFLWFVRHYMVFMCLAPLAIGFVGVGKASFPRRLAAAAFMVVILGALYYTGSGSRVVESAASTYSQATNVNVMHYNAASGNGVVRGSGVITTSYPEALVYTIFAPFPWQFGSVGLQLGKIEALIFYWFIYTVYKNRKRLWAEHRATVTMMATFIVPATLAYAMTMSNVGLIVRQRMPIVIAVAILAGIAYRRPVPKRAPAVGRGSTVLRGTESA